MTWYSVFLKVLDKHAPQKKRRIKYSFRPGWLTLEVLDAMRYRDYLLKLKLFDEYKKEEEKSHIHYSRLPQKCFAEIKTAIRALKDQKAPGPDGLIDGLIREFYKNSTVHILPFLVKFFNFIFHHGLFPDEWSLAILNPLHKKGDINVPDNYRVYPYAIDAVNCIILC